MKRPRVLILDDSKKAAQELQGLLSSCAITNVAVTSWLEARDLFCGNRFDAVILDLKTAPMDGRNAMNEIQREVPNTSVIGICNTVDRAELAECLSIRPFQCLNRRLDQEMMVTVLDRALLRSQLWAGSCCDQATSRERRGRTLVAEIIGDSDAMQQVYHSISKVAQSDSNICLYGESGTGKELIARAIHQISRRRDYPFVILDCAAIPEGLMESDMFGHVRGAFTSAVEDRAGVFQLADNGTLLLDEVAELPISLQSKLLRVIQKREFRRVGSSHSVRVNVRIIAATNRDLADLVNRGHFREDLFYRLDVIRIVVPPLRDRKEDIPLLVQGFIEDFNRRSQKQIRGISARAQRLLLMCDWPGNVRELQNCIERAGVMAEGDIIDIEDLRQILHPKLQAEGQPEHGLTLREREKALILEALQQSRGNKTAAAALLRISLRGLHYKLKRHGLQGHSGTARWEKRM